MAFVDEQGSKSVIGLFLLLVFKADESRADLPHWILNKGLVLVLWNNKNR